MTQRDIKPIIKEVKETLEEIYGERLKGVILYGSHARGDAEEGSDIDFIILLEKAKTPVIERNPVF
jgi:predicted nucleotidyltransferase